MQYIIVGALFIIVVFSSLLRRTLSLHTAAPLLPSVFYPCLMSLVHVLLMQLVDQTILPQSLYL